MTMSFYTLSDQDHQDIINHQAVLLDVRSPEEYSDYHIDNAINFDVIRLEQGELPNADKTTPVFTYCRSGRRSEVAKQILTASGFTKVYNLGGIDGVMQ